MQNDLGMLNRYDPPPALPDGLREAVTMFEEEQARVLSDHLKCQLSIEQARLIMEYKPIRRGGDLVDDYHCGRAMIDAFDAWQEHDEEKFCHAVNRLAKFEGLT